MKKKFNELIKKTVTELEKELLEIKYAVQKVNLESVISPQKDTNSYMKMKKKIAMLKTAMFQKQESKVSKIK